MSTHSLLICCQFSLVRKIPFNIFCTAGLLAASSHLSESAFRFPLSLRDKFEVDRVFVFSFIILYFEEVAVLFLTIQLFLQAQCALSVCAALTIAPLLCSWSLGYNSPGCAFLVFLEVSACCWNLYNVFQKNWKKVSLSVAHICILYTLCPEVSMIHIYLC